MYVSCCTHIINTMILHCRYEIHVVMRHYGIHQLLVKHCSLHHLSSSLDPPLIQRTS